MSVNIKIRADGAIEGSAENDSGKQTVKIVSRENGKFTKIVKEVDCRNNTVRVIHSAWGKDFYHQDTKFPEKILMDKEFCERKLKEKQDLRLTIKKVIQNNRTKGNSIAE